MKSIKLSLGCLILIVAIACSKKTEPVPVVVTPPVITPPSTPVDNRIVYSIGYLSTNGANTIATIWANSSPTSLSNGSANAYAKCISILGSAIYVGGIDNNKATIWKNGIGTSLADNGLGGQVNAIFTIGTDVYAAGYVFVNNSLDNHAALWKNGTLTILETTKKSNAFGVYVVGADVYVCGYNGSNPNVVAAVWKNGVVTNLSDGRFDTYPYAISGSGTDVYIVGKGVGTTAWQAKIWKNGMLSNLSDGITNGVANTIYVAGSDVYIAGTSIWKNSINTGLTVPTEVTSLYVSNDDVFITGTTYYPIYWKNGTEVRLSNSFGAIFGIAVK